MEKETIYLLIIAGLLIIVMICMRLLWKTTISKSRYRNIIKSIELRNKVHKDLENKEN